MNIATTNLDTINNFKVGAKSYKLGELKKAFPCKDKNIKNHKNYINATHLVKEIFEGNLGNFTRREVVKEIIKNRPHLVLQFKGSKPSMVHQDLLPMLIASFDWNYAVRLNKELHKTISLTTKKASEDKKLSPELLLLLREFIQSNTKEDYETLVELIQQEKMDVAKLKLVLKISTDFSLENILDKVEKI